MLVKELWRICLEYSEYKFVQNFTDVFSVLYIPVSDGVLWSRLYRHGEDDNRRDVSKSNSVLMARIECLARLGEIDPDGRVVVKMVNGYGSFMPPALPIYSVEVDEDAKEVTFVLSTRTMTYVP